MPVSVKICGLTEETAVHAVAGAGIDYAGFVHFSPSPRHITLEKAARLKALLPGSVACVSVLVDPDDALIGEVCRLLAPHYLQLHGNETPGRLRHIRKQFPSVKLIKALKIRSGDDVAQAQAFGAVADALLFDARAPELPGMLPGGNGLSFDWALLRNHDFPLPWFLSGGLNADNVLRAVHMTGAPMVDISSGVERAPGVKDTALITAFINRVRSL